MNKISTDQGFSNQKAEAADGMVDWRYTWFSLGGSQEWDLEIRDMDPSNPLELIILGRSPCESCGPPKLGPQAHL